MKFQIEKKNIFLSETVFYFELYIFKLDFLRKFKLNKKTQKCHKNFHFCRSKFFKINKSIFQLIYFKQVKQT